MKNLYTLILMYGSFNVLAFRKNKSVSQTPKVCERRKEGLSSEQCDQPAERKAAGSKYTSLCLCVVDSSFLFPV